MKNYISLFCFSLLIVISCSEDRNIEDDLIGSWIYERESFNSGIPFEDPDTRGVMIFNEDETGSWESDNGFSFRTETEWDLQSLDTKISITRLPGEFSNFSSTQIYDIKQSGENTFTFTYEFSFNSTQDTIPSITRFENIILTRM